MCFQLFMAPRRKTARATLFLPTAKPVARPKTRLLALRETRVPAPAAKTRKSDPNIVLAQGATTVLVPINCTVEELHFRLTFSDRLSSSSEELTVGTRVPAQSCFNVPHRTVQLGPSRQGGGGTWYRPLPLRLNNIHTKLKPGDGRETSPLVWYKAFHHTRILL